MIDVDLAVALARAAGDSQLAVGGVTAAGPGSGSDFLQSLIEALAYAADVLEADLDKLADEAFIETSYDRGPDILRAQFRVDLRPVVCVVLDPHDVYLATVGGETGGLHVCTSGMAHKASGRRPGSSRSPPRIATATATGAARSSSLVWGLTNRSG